MFIMYTQTYIYCVAQYGFPAFLSIHLQDKTAQNPNL